MDFHQALVAEDSDAGDGVHALRVQEAGELGYVTNVDMLPAGQRVIKAYQTLRKSGMV